MSDNQFSKWKSRDSVIAPEGNELVSDIESNGFLDSLNLKIEHLPLDQIVADVNSPKTHPPAQIEQLCRNIANFGFLFPITIDQGNGIIAGHARLEAAKALGMANVPTIRLSHLNKAQSRAVQLADNRIAENASWNQSKLTLFLQEIIAEIPDFDLTLTGFETPEIDIALGTTSSGEMEIAPEAPDFNSPSVTSPGDLWVIGDHKLLCADARHATAYENLMGSGRAAMIFTDPPYNVKINGNVTSGNHHPEFAMASGEMTDAEYEDFLKGFLARLKAWSNPSALVYVAIDWRHDYILKKAAFAQDLELINQCVWVKSNAGMGSFYRSQHEFFLVFRNGSAPHTNNVQLGRFGRNRSNVWTYAGFNTFSAERDDALKAHPTVKPTALVQDAILDASRRGEVILDPFLGSGTTLIAAEKAGRICASMEISPHYCDVALRRAIEHCDLKPLLAATGESFEEVRHRRLGEVVSEDADV